MHPSLAALLAQAEDWLMHVVPDAQLIDEAIAINHGGVDRPTREKYEKHLEHLSAYLDSVHGRTFYTAERSHIRLFQAHLEEAGGSNPHKTRLPCRWCRQRGYPDGRVGPGWSASTRKSYLSAARFLYAHFAGEKHLPDIDPTTHVKGPKLTITPQYTPTEEEIRALLEAPGKPKDRLLAYWTFYAPSRRQTYADARWRDIDLERGTWFVVGKGKQPDCWPLHPLLIRELRQYRDWQLEEAARNPRVRDALADASTAYVLLTRTGRRTAPQTITKLLKWRAQRAGIAVVTATSAFDSPGGKTSRLSAHAMRRGWADYALNHPTDPVPIDVVSEVLNHKDISTTRRHYARTKPDRARHALRTMHLDDRPYRAA